MDTRSGRYGDGIATRRRRTPMDEDGTADCEEEPVDIGQLMDLLNRTIKIYGQSAPLINRFRIVGAQAQVQEIAFLSLRTPPHCAEM